jgi:hypothetical protein
VSFNFGAQTMAVQHRRISISGHCKPGRHRNPGLSHLAKRGAFPTNSRVIFGANHAEIQCVQIAH